MKLRYLMSVMAFAAVGMFTACDDTESVDINDPNIENQNSELYTQYLANLKQYKASSHKVVFAWFDNSATQPASQGQTIAAVPDSLDYLVLTSPATLTAQQQQQMADIKEKKGIKSLFEINYTTIRNAYDAELQAFTENPDNAGKTFASFNDYLVSNVAKQLTAGNQFNYDGIVFTFNALTKTYMYDEEKAEEIGYENDFLGIAKDWIERNPTKTLILAGKPQNVEDKTVLDLAKYIILPCQTATNAGGLTYNMTKAAVDGVPAEKLLPLVNLYSLDQTDVKTGYWGTEYAVLGAARWVAAEHAHNAAGLAITDLGNDYYHANFVYPTVREAISIINPNAKE